eukprot:1117722-Rhodomonas_salina.1
MHHAFLEKCAGTQNVADALTKSVPGPTLSKHREFLLGTRAHFQAHSATVTRAMSGVAERRPWHRDRDADRSSAGGVTGLSQHQSFQGERRQCHSGHVSRMAGQTPADDLPGGERRPD